MTNNLLSTNQLIAIFKRASTLSFLFVFCLFISGCQTTAVLKDVVINGCGTSTIYLSGWWTNVTNKSSIEFDPMGGYLFVYWIDDAGNACHGDPGRNGQIGPAVIKAFRPQANELATKNSSIPEGQLKTYQDIPVSFDNYAGSGLHFVQFNNNLLRLRSDGKVLKLSGGEISIPAITEIGSKACFAPVALHPIQTMFVPSINTVTTQDPSRCKVRSLPFDASMNEENRKKYDVLNTTHGSEIFEVP